MSKPGAAKALESNPNDIPKEELLQLCMKLNKRMQALESKHSDLIAKYKSLSQERTILLDVIRNSLTVPVAENDDISTVIEIWRHQCEEERSYLRKLEEEVRLSKSLQSEPLMATEQDESLEVQELKSELEKSRIIEKNLRCSLSNCELTSMEKNQRIEELEKRLESERAAREEDLVFFRMQQMKSEKGSVIEDVKTVAELSDAKQKILLQSSELDEQRSRIEILLEQTRQYEKKIFGLESEVDRYKEKYKELEKNSGASAVLKAEQEALLNSLRRDLKIALTAKEDATRHVKDLEEYRGRAEGQLVKLVEYKEKAAAAEESINELQALNARLLSDLQTVETNHAKKTALLASAEVEIESLKDESQSLKQIIAKSVEELELMRKELRTTNEKLTTSVLEKESVVNSYEHTISKIQKEHCKEIELLQVAHSKELQDLTKDFSKKSATATQLLSDRDFEIKDLRSKISNLKDEIASGSPSERRIFELAQSQANREATIGANIDSRDIAFQQLQNALASKDLELARLQQIHVQLVAEITELRRMSKREGVNMDYLKNIVLQYMSFPPASPEKNSLVPVLALLLQFSPAELKIAEEASRAPSWTSLPIKEVKIPPLHRNNAKPTEIQPSSAPLVSNLQYNEV